MAGRKDTSRHKAVKDGLVFVMAREEFSRRKKKNSK